ncbi:MAG TPA: hypothetical protein VEK31_10485 [Xanthobacteraceae bacterium]|nr:hypothetical protein [Xanthobacteraceae bacterium]
MASKSHDSAFLDRDEAGDGFSGSILSPRGDSCLFPASMDPARREKGLADLRKTVEKIVIYPTGAYKPIYFKIYGDAGRLLRLSEEAAAPECHDEKFMRVVVAGVGFEPTTFRL